ncbi:prephenate dehydrogenase [Albibacterium sp.]|uniref:prephenate dehydrogenase n=1 Tax=Albibacterium sp. TaxID=2952885 RepID=UPI002C28F231|nr:prephenate dehydrogenase [Albibacterium sp.]HUH17703.1 prephenate dehydrogenase [Albibacterium sp.]
MKISIIGVGLIGGSLALSLRKAVPVNKIFGVDTNSGNLNKALELGIIDATSDLDKAISDSDLIILTIPVNSIQELLPTILDQITKDQVVMEMGSTQQEILESIKDHPKRGRLVAVHPMAGTEYSGPEAAVDDLFTGKNMVFCDIVQTDPDAFEIAESICEALKMNPVFMNGKEHDLHTAYVSHISHITSFALALTVLEKEKSQGRIFELAGGGFASTVRLAKSSPEMWVPIFKQNKKNVLEVLEEHIRQLQRMHDVLEMEDYDALFKLIKQSNKIKRIIK